MAVLPPPRPVNGWGARRLTYRLHHIRAKGTTAANGTKRRLGNIRGTCRIPLIGEARSGARVFLLKSQEKDKTIRYVQKIWVRICDFA